MAQGAALFPYIIKCSTSHMHESLHCRLNVYVRGRERGRSLAASTPQAPMAIRRNDVGISTPVPLSPLCGHNPIAAPTQSDVHQWDRCSRELPRSHAWRGTYKRPGLGLIHGCCGCSGGCLSVYHCMSKSQTACLGDWLQETLLGEIPLVCLR